MKFPEQEKISYNDDSFTGRKYLHMKKFALPIEIFFPGSNLLLREKIIYPKKLYGQNFSFLFKIKKIDLSNGKNYLNRRKKQKSKL